jgi:superfamily I DNA/RNA helicase
MNPIIEELANECLAKVMVTIGPPGCGKTRWLSEKASEAARKYGSNAILIASLTKTAAAEVAQRHIPIPKDRIGTLHSHAFHALGFPTLVDSKHIPEWNEFIEKNMLPLSEEFGHKTGGDIKKFKMSAKRGHNAIDEPKTDELSTSAYFGMYILSRSRLVPREKWVSTDIQLFGFAWERWKEETGRMDFEDLIEKAADRNAPAPGRPMMIYLDECQDLSTSEYRLVLTWAKYASALIVVGDPDQALYTWRGADPDLFLWMAEKHPARKDVPRDTYRRVLSQSYRVPTAVQQYAVRWINTMEGREQVEYSPRVNTNGRVKRLGNGLKDRRFLVREILSCLARWQDVMVLTSCDYMLQPLIASLRAEGIPFHNPYRKRRGDWNPIDGQDRLRNYLRPDPSTYGEAARPWNWKELYSWIEIIDSEYLKRGTKTDIKLFATEHPDLQIAKTLTEALEVCRDCFRSGGLFDWQPRDFSGFRALIHRTRKEKEGGKQHGAREKRLEYAMRLVEKYGGKKLLEKPRIVVGTIHSVKGAEADVVFVSPEIPPVAWETRMLLEQKRCLLRQFYVAFTRAKEELYLLRQESGCAMNLPMPAFDVAS